MGIEGEHQGSEVANKKHPVLADCALNTESSTRGQREETVQREMSQLNCRHPRQLQSLNTGINVNRRPLVIICF